MMSRPRRLLGLIPVAIAFLLSDKTLASFGVMLIGGIVFWAPYWLAWWLSDGFSNISLGGAYDDSGASGYRSGSQGYGHYSGHTRIDL